MSILALAICAINSIHGVFIPCCKKGAVSVGLFLTLVAITKTFESALVAIIAAVMGFFWFLLYGTFIVIRDLVTNKV
jgi:hydrogenase/urease accessory protein HupE